MKSESNQHSATEEGLIVLQEEVIGFLSLREILGDPSRGMLPIIPVSPSTWWLRVKEGSYPRPIKHGGRSFWLRRDIYALVRKIEAHEI